MLPAAGAAAKQTAPKRETRVSKPELRRALETLVADQIVECDAVRRMPTRLPRTGQAPKCVGYNCELRKQISHRLSMSSPSVRAALNKLALASKLLIGAALVHLLLFVPKSVADARLVFEVVWFLSTTLCILGFLLANSQLGLTSGTADLLQPRMVIGRRAERQARWSLVLMFYFAFLVPVLNLLIAAFTYFRIHSAVAAHRRQAADARASAARRESKFGPMGSR